MTTDKYRNIHNNVIIINNYVIIVTFRTTIITYIKNIETILVICI